MHTPQWWATQETLPAATKAGTPGPTARMDSPTYGIPQHTAVTHGMRNPFMLCR